MTESLCQVPWGNDGGWPWLCGRERPCPDHDQPTTPGEALRLAAGRTNCLDDSELLTAMADELDAARATDPAPAACRHCGGTGWAEHPLVPTTICEDCKGTGVGQPAPATPPEHQAARTYELPAEPSPEVTELWDREGVKWVLVAADGSWQPADDPEGFGIPWVEALAYGPLSSTPPAGTEPASATAVDPPAGTVGT